MRLKIGMNILKLILSISLICVMGSCRTITRTIETEVPVPVEVIKKEYVYSYNYDSIAQRDSVDRYTRNDTTFIYREKEVWRYKVRVDTITQTDSIQVPVEVRTTETITKEVNVLYWWQKILLWIGGASLIGLLCCLFNVGSFIKKIINTIRKQ
jgi:hypothetical protein